MSRGGYFDKTQRVNLIAKSNLLQCRKVLIFQGWSVYGWTRDDFPLIFIVKDRLLYWSTTPLPNMYLRLWRKRSVCARVPLAYSTSQAPSPAFCERTSDSVLPIN